MKKCNKKVKGGDRSFSSASTMSLAYDELVHGHAAEKINGKVLRTRLLSL